MDRSFLNENCQNRENLRPIRDKVYLWHLPLGTTEENIKEFLESKLSEDEMKSVDIPPGPCPALAASCWLSCYHLRFINIQQLSVYYHIRHT